MLKWKYKPVDSNEVPRERFLKRKSRGVLEAYLNQLGEQGWEFINIDFTDGIGISFVGVAKRERKDKQQGSKKFL
ncbi:hypothetical protein BR63_08095 [Thermanaerosceptrum fracticalcis]|uniref:DUF4177 domain-containing protein n=1 Tax=Thermanaerosceptrum fracticalcis TaxID=1712410 RepID=A0A7G6E2H4_THEFR|nr:hypothetical protein [Thermanaerosceptrum fracticalcis]QNB46278.1 hypothetical protein BR63_08095 [Thermanaerosceptrum fracticalcis]